MAEMHTTYDHRDSKYVLGSVVRHANGHRPLISDGFIDFLRPEPIILQQGIPTVIDWSNVEHIGTPVHIADQPDTKTPCSPIFAVFVTVDATTHTTTILIPLTYTDFRTLRLFFYYANDAVAKPVPLIPVDLPEAGDYRLRNDLFCVFQKRHENVDSLCECSTKNGYVDPWGVALLATLTPVVASRIVSDSILPLQNTHILGTMRGETIRPNDHIFAQRPQPATQVPALKSLPTEHSLGKLRVNYGTGLHTLHHLLMLGSHLTTRQKKNAWFILGREEIPDLYAHLICAQLHDTDRNAAVGMAAVLEGHTQAISWVSRDQAAEDQIICLSLSLLDVICPRG